MVVQVPPSEGEVEAEQQDWPYDSYRKHYAPLVPQVMSPCDHLFGEEEVELVVRHAQRCERFGRNDKGHSRHRCRHEPG